MHVSTDDAFDMGPELEAPPAYREFGRPPKYVEDGNGGYETVEQLHIREPG